MRQSRSIGWRSRFSSIIGWRAIAACIVGLASLTSADVIVLKDGRRLQGREKGDTAPY